MIYQMRSAKEVGDRIRFYLPAEKEKIEKLISSLDISEKDFQAALEGEKLFSYNHIQKICSFININIDTLLFGE